MPRCLASVANDIVFAKRVWLAHLCGYRSVKDEAVQPTSLPIDDLEHDVQLLIALKNTAITSRSRARPSSVSKPETRLFRCRFRSVAILM